MKLRRRRLFLAILATLVGTAGLGWFLATREDEDVRRFRRIKMGMELEAVKKLYPEQLPQLSANMLSPDRVNTAITSDWIWMLEHGILTVSTDPQQNVTKATYVYWPEEQWLDTVLEWFRIGSTKGSEIRVYELTVP